MQRTMLELINQLDGFDPRGNIKVLMATNRPDTLDPALMRPGRLDRKIEFSLPDLEVRMLSFTAKYFLTSECFFSWGITRYDSKWDMEQSVKALSQRPVYIFISPNRVAELLLTAFLFPFA